LKFQVVEGALLLSPIFLSQTTPLKIGATFYLAIPMKPDLNISVIGHTLSLSEVHEAGNAVRSDLAHDRLS
jgi:hypothetical protein